MKENQNFSSRLFGKDTAPKDAMSVKVKERFNPTSTLYATTILILSELAKTQEEMLARSEKMQLAQRAKALGFTNSYEVAEQRQFNKNVELLQFMVEMWRDLGRGVILIGNEHFRDILRKHDLMCVPFSHYKGDIPAKNLAEIEQALTSVRGKRKYSGYPATSIFSRSAKELIDNIRFPWHYTDRYDAIGEPRALHFTYDTDFQSPLFIAAPKEFVGKPDVGFYENYSISRYWESDENEDRRERANYILREIKDYANVRFAAAPTRLPLNYDPFVCSLCNYGVIIHSMWGAEAEDATIKRYEQLRDAIIGGAK